MNSNNRINAFIKLGDALSVLIEDHEANGLLEPNELSKAIVKAHQLNKWFTPEFVLKSLKSIVNMLDGKSILNFYNNYSEHNDQSFSPKKVGVIMAGNIPAVAFHDVLCVLLNGKIMVGKCSSDDTILMPFLMDILVNIEPNFKNQVVFTDRISQLDAVIATGSNNSARYFEYYFRNIPSIIRKNRNSIAVLDGNESANDLVLLANDIFDYFGLGCRNVSKLFVPTNYNFDSFFEAMESKGDFIQHNKYMNNYDYHRALFLLDGIPFLTNNFLILRAANALPTPVSVLHYEYYDDISSIPHVLEEIRDLVQCVVGVGGLPFGSAQQPSIFDYADGVDTMAFLQRF